MAYTPRVHIPDATVFDTVHDDLARFWYMVFLVAIAERATEIRFESVPATHTGLRVRINSELYEMIPPPREQLWHLGNALYNLAKVDFLHHPRLALRVFIGRLYRRTVTVECGIRVVVAQAEVPMEVSVTAIPPASTEATDDRSWHWKITFEISECGISASLVARDILEDIKQRQDEEEDTEI